MSFRKRIKTVILTMKILTINTYPDSILRTRCKPVEEITPQIRELFQNMLLTMSNFRGIGLAAPQVGVDARIIVVDIGKGAIKIANPMIIKINGSDIMEEGCLSVPNTQIKIKRPYKAVIEGMDEKGMQIEIKAEGLLSRVLLHEIDHLNGRLIIDRLNVIERMLYYYKQKKKALSGFHR